MKRIIYVILLLFLFCCCEEKDDFINKIKIGQTKDEAHKILGEPGEIQQIEKTTEFIWGPEESFWHEIPTGTRLEVWIYQFEDSLLRLYFLRDEGHISYKITSPKDTVYEPVN